MGITCIIVDDEDNNVENLRNLLSVWCPDVRVLATAASAEEGAEVIRQYRPDLVFLDIQMPGSSGFDLLRSFKTISFEVIFITAFDQYGIQAIKFSALDYLLKPVNITEMQEAVEKAREKIAARQENRNIGNLLEYIQLASKEPPKIALPTLKEIIYVRIDEIIRCEAADNYTTFFLNSGQQVLVCKTLKEFSDLLQPHGFIRTHQSHLANARFVKSLLKEDGGTLMMEDHSKVPISRQNRERVKNALKAAING